VRLLFTALVGATLRAPRLLILAVLGLTAVLALFATQAVTVEDDAAVDGP
jgi:hypothetical protein